MSAAQLQRLFQPFEQVGKERRRAGSTFWFELDLPVVSSGVSG